MVKVWEKRQRRQNEVQLSPEVGNYSATENTSCGGLAEEEWEWQAYKSMYIVNVEDEDVIKRVSAFIIDAGVTHFAYRSDREDSIRKLLAQAAQIANVKAIDESNLLLLPRLSLKNAMSAKARATDWQSERFNPSKARSVVSN